MNTVLPSQMQTEKIFVEQVEQAEQINRAAQFVSEKIGTADIAVVMGSGLSNFYNELKDVITISYKDIPFMPQVTIYGHEGKIVCGYINDRKVICFAGRVHGYEGISFHEVCFQVRLSKLLGCKIYALTNATGGLLDGMKAGSLCLITDHIKFLARVDPLRELHEESIINKFNFDSDTCWSEECNQIIKRGAKELNIELFDGVYCWTSGPTYETPCEVKIAKTIGGAVLGMSTVPEVIAAKAVDMEVFGLSLVCNLGAGLVDQVLDHEDVMVEVEKSKKPFHELLKYALSNVPMPKKSVVRENKMNKIINKKEFPCDNLSNAISHSCKILEKFGQLDLAIFVSFGHEQLLDILNNVQTIHLSELEYFPSNTISGSTGKLHCGTILGKKVLMIQSTDIEGFSVEEASFFALILYKLGIKFSIQTLIGANSKPQLLKDPISIIGDVINATRNTKPFSYLYNICPPNETILTESIISPKMKNYLPNMENVGLDHTYMAWSGPTFPTNAEHKMSNEFFAEIVGVTSPMPIYTLRYFGIEVLPIATIGQTENITMDIQQIIQSCKIERLQSLIPEIIKSVIDKVPILKHVPLEDKIENPMKIFPSSERAMEVKEFIKNQFKSFMGENRPKIAIIDVDLSLPLVDEVSILGTISIKKIPHTKFAGRKDPNLSLCKYENTTFFLLWNLAYEYEFASAIDINVILRALKSLGVTHMIITNSSISTNDEFIGEICNVTDHFNFSGRNPLIGPNLEEYGPRFPDMTYTYKTPFHEHIQSLANLKNVQMFFTSNRFLYSKSELKVAKKFNCDCIASLGYSEIILNRHMDVRTALLSITTKFGNEIGMKEKKKLVNLLLEIVQSTEKLN